jgi:hypothetical protein
MKTIARSNIAKRFGAVLAISIAGAMLAGSIVPAAAGKHGGGGGGGHHHHHHHHDKPKSPKNPGPIGPLPRPQSQPMPKPVPQPPVVRDHRTPAPVVVRDHRTPGGGVTVTNTAKVRDHRATATPARGKTTTVKVAGVKILTVKSAGRR